MRIEYALRHDILNVEFLEETPITESVELDGIIVDYDKDKRVVAIEILDASKRTTKDPLELIDVAIVRDAT